MDLSKKPELTETKDGKYLKAADCGEGFSAQLAIAKVDCDLFGEGTEEKEKLIVFFKGKDKGITLSLTNTNACIAAFGDETENWRGKKVLLTTKYYDKFSTFGFIVNVLKDEDPNDDIPW